jgi:O-antigen/teichoic acid export membrane protein
MSEGLGDVVVGVSRRRVTAGGAVNLFVRLLALALGLATTAILARTLGPTSYGYVALALGLAAIAVGVGDFGLTQVAIREAAAGPASRHRTIGALVVLRVSSTLLLSAVVVVVGLLLLPDEADAMVVLVGLALPIASVASVQAVAQARFRLDLASVALLAQSVIWLAGTAIAASQGASLAAFGFAYVVAATVQSVVAMLAARHVSSVSISRSWESARQLLRLAWPLGLAGVFVTCYYRVDGVLLFAVAGSDETAYYLAAYKLLDVLQVIPAVATAVLLPYLAVGVQRRVGVQERTAIRSALGLLGIVAIPAVVGGMVLAAPIISFVYGPEFESSAALLAILLPAYLSICVGYVFATAVIVSGRVAAYATVAGIAAVLNVAVNIALIPVFGAYAAAIVTLLTEFSVCTTIALLATRGRPRTYLPLDRWSRTFAASAVMAGVALFLRDQHVLVAIGACVVVYVIAGVAVGGLRRQDLALLGQRGEFVRG